MNVSTHYEYPGVEAEFGLYNFHRLETVNLLADLMGSDGEGDPRVIRLFGEAGTGRHYLLRAAAYYASLGRTPVRVESLDCDGYEPDRPLRDLLSYLAEQSAGVWSERFAELARRVKVDVKVSAPTLLFASVGVKSDLSVEEILNFLNSSTGTPAGQISDRQRLGIFMTRATRNCRLVLHFRRAGVMDRALLARLLDEQKLNRDLILALSYDIGETASSQISSSLKVRIPAWTEEEMSRCFAERFQPNKVPRDFLEFAWSFSPRVDGRQAFASRLLRSANGGWLSSDRRGTWLMIRGWQEDEGFTKEFERDLYEPLLDLEARLSEMEATHLRQGVHDFLDLAAMCDPTVPVRILAECLEIEPEQVDDFIDLIDELTDADGENGLLRVVGFRHPGFPRGMLIYRYRNPARAAAILERKQDTRQAAARLLSLLERQFRPDTRAAVELFLKLSRLAQQSRSAERHAIQLAWWTSIEDAEGLVSVVAGQLVAGEISPDLVWEVVEQTDGSWPPSLRLVLLEGYRNQPDGIPQHRKFRFFMVMGGILLEVGRFAEASAAAEEVKDNLPQPVWQSSMQQCSLAGSTEYELGQYSRSNVNFSHALALAQANLPPEHPDTLTSMINLALTLLAQGDEAGAYRLEEQVLSARRRVLGEEHPHTLAAMSNLAVTLSARGDLAKARALHEQVLSAVRRLVGEEHPKTLAAMSNLASVLSAQGDKAMARSLFEQVLSVSRRVLGEEHPHTLTAISNVATTLSAQGNEASARSLFKQGAFGQPPRARGRASGHFNGDG